MDKELLRKVQLAQLEIAKEIKRICDENGIQYFLDSGSLLGAVRHKGFIPWDDDMDFGMIRSEYDRFIKLAPKKLKPEYCLQTFLTDTGYPLAFCKILKKGTVFIEDVFADSNKHNELYVDIFPYHVYPQESYKRRWQKLLIQHYKHLLMMKDGMKPWIRPQTCMGKLGVMLKYAPFKVGSLIINRDRIIERYESTLRLFDMEQTDAYFPAGATKYGRWVIPKKCFVEYVKLPFEDTEFSCPVGWDLYLKSAYGDYMKLPPKDQREIGHHVIEVKL